MATINGVSEHSDDASVSSSHLGKRKRSTTPKSIGTIDDKTSTSIVQTIQNLLPEIRKVDSSPSLLQYPLPSISSDERSPKRTRLSPGQEADTIEHRILSGIYNSIDALLKDVKSVRDRLSEDVENASINGKPRNAVKADILIEQITKLADTVPAEKTEKKQNIKKESDDVSLPTNIVAEHPTGQVLYLRTQTEKGTQQLFSGLQSLENEPEGTFEIDGRKLPNGFDLTEPATMDANITGSMKEKRTFGDVFRPHRNLKQLEAPRSNRNPFRGNKLSFVSDPISERPTPANKLDYKYQNLTTGSWLSYSHGSAMHDHEWRRRQRERTLSGGDFKAALVANAVGENEADKMKSLFNAAFSSFAPTSDNSKAVISEQDRNRQWWHQNGRGRLLSVFAPEYSDDGLDGIATTLGDQNNDDFEDVVANFEPFEEQEEIPALQDVPDGVDDVLTEISNLLETLHSYQKIRTLDIRASVSTPKPSSAEYDVYEVLKSQLSILVGSLPPFAVAKLDGDKLKDLNVSTSILVKGADYAGTSQIDDYTLQRQKAAGASMSAALRNQTQPKPIQNRPPYQTPVGINRYGANVGAYGQNTAIPATAAYGQRTAAPYQTPRAPAAAPRPYSQTSYQQTGNSYGSQQPTVQQFQRPLTNGYANYNATPTQPGYMRPGQPGFQQKAPDNTMMYGRSTSPGKPAINGHTPVPNPAPTYQRPPSQGSAPNQQHAMADQKPAIEAKSYKQESGTTSLQSPGPVDGMTNRNGPPTLSERPSLQAA